MEAAPKKLGDRVEDAVPGFEHAQQAPVDGIPPFSLLYQYMFCSIINRRDLGPGSLVGGMTEVRDTGGAKDWAVVDMKHERKVIRPPEKKGRLKTMSNRLGR